MEFGACGNPDLVSHMPEGYTFLESTVTAMLKPREDETAFRAALKEYRAAALPCRVLNCFIPGDLKITGPTADMAALEEYVTVALRRAKEAGVDTIVFGSGGARAYPEGFSHAKGFEQIKAFCRMLGPIAAKHKVTIVLEPLYRKGCNNLNTVAEGAALVRELDDPAIRLLADSFHVLHNEECLEDIVANGDLIRHVHVASVPKRLAPGTDECDLAPFFDALKRADYNWRVSIEANFPEPDKDLRLSLAAMKSFMKGACK